MATATPIAGHTLTPRDCADYMGRSDDFILLAIRRGDLRASMVRRPGARLGRWVVAEGDFRAFLQAIGWPRLPKVAAEPR